MAAPQPISDHQRELVNIVKAAHRTLGLARDTRSAEQARRLQEAKIAAAREWEAIEYGIRDDIDREIAAHASNLDEALIAAVNGGVPIRRIALDAFGSQFDGAVRGKLTQLRDDGRVGSIKGHQRNTSPATEREVVFPKPINVEAVLEEATAIALPVFEWLGSYEVTDGLQVENAVLVTMDSRDPFFRTIQDRASYSADRTATTVVLYENPYKPDDIRAGGFSLSPEDNWMNPVAYWCALHPEQMREQFYAAIASAGK